MQKIKSYSYKRLAWLMSAVALALVVCLPCPGLALEYGADGPYNVVRESFANPAWASNDVSVFLPVGTTGPVPVLFFSHGLGGTYWFGYRSMLEHVASRGIAVVFSPYPTSFNYTNQYNILWNGFQEAAKLYAADFDLERVGFAGHSWGGGATTNMALRATRAGWGGRGMCLFIMAPSPAYAITDAELQSLTHVDVITQVYENDTICPHSWAKNAYDKIGSVNKAWYYVYGADHFTPTESAAYSDLHQQAIWKPLDALMDYTFGMYTPYEGMLFALYGVGDHYQTDVTGVPGTPPPAGDDDPPTSDDPPTNGDDPADDDGSSSGWSWLSWLFWWMR